MPEGTGLFCSVLTHKHLLSLKTSDKLNCGHQVLDMLSKACTNVQYSRHIVEN